MAVSHIDGRVEAAELRRQRGTMHQFKLLRFTLDGGGERTLKNAIVHSDVARFLIPGTAGRFYLYNQMDARGVYAFRDPAGTVVNNYPQHTERLFLTLIFLNIGIALLFEFLLGNGTPVLVLIALAIGVVGFIATRLMRGRAAKAIAADNPGSGAGMGPAAA